MHTIVMMEISAAAYDEIKRKLVAAGYDQAVIGAGDDNALDMHGIGLVRGKEESPDWWWRDLDPDDSGDTPHEAMRNLPLYCVSALSSSYRGYSCFGVKYQKPDDDEEYVELFDDQEAAMAFAKEKFAAMKDMNE